MPFIVYFIPEIPVELIREIVDARIAELAGGAPIQSPVPADVEALTRHWAVYVDGELLAVVLYRKRGGGHRGDAGKNPSRKDQRCRVKTLYLIGMGMGDGMVEMLKGQR